MEFLSLGKCFFILSKKYAGSLSAKLEGTPIEKYFIPFHVIARSHGHINQCQLGETLLIDKATIVKIIDTLSENGMITRKMNPVDRREYLLKVTEEGEKWAQFTRQCITEVNDIFLSFLPEEQRQNFTDSLLLMTDSVMEYPVKPQKEF